MHTRMITYRVFKKIASLMTCSIYSSAVASSASTMAMPIHQLFPREGFDKNCTTLTLYYYMACKFLEEIKYGRVRGSLQRWIPTKKM